MTVSPGNLDSLLNISYPIADTSAVSLQSETGASFSLITDTFSYSTVTLNTTGVPGFAAAQGEQLNIVGINDTDNTITYSLSIGGLSLGQSTEYIVGYSANDLLVSFLPFNGFVEGLLGNLSASNGIVSVLSSSPVPAQSSITFSSFGNAALTPPPPPGEVVLHGSSSQYIIADNNGSPYIQDTMSGRDGTQTLSGVNEMLFTDGVGIFDPTGTAEDVARLYATTLNRAPDVAGLKYWTAQVDDSHIPLINVATSLATSPEFIQNYGSLSNPAFVNQLYENVLGRPADAPGALYWDGVLASGGTRGSVVLGLAESPENEANTMSTAGDTNNAEAYRLYRAALNRAPDPAGQAFWSSVLANGATPTQVAQDFINSPEFQQDYGTLSASDFVSTLYRNVLHRAADPAGLQY